MFESTPVHQSHSFYDRSIPNFEDFEFDRLPSGEPPIWIACEDKSVTKKKAFEKVREMLEGETSVLVHVFDEEIVKYCEELGWTAGYAYNGFEAEVSFTNIKLMKVTLLMT